MRSTEPPPEESGDADLVRQRRLAALPEHKRALLEALRSQRSGVDLPGLELLRNGVGPAVVLVHPVGGEVLCYGELVRLLPPGYPVYGVSADQALRADSPPSLDSLVRHYVSKVERSGVHVGLLGGWSFGGIAAYEMARRLAERGKPCPVAVLDAIPAQANQASRVPTEAQLREAFAFDLVRSAGARPEDLHLDFEIWELPRRDSMAALQANLELYDIRSTLTVDDLADRALVHANAYRSLESHRPQSGGPPVSLLWATESVTDPTAWWHTVAGDPLRAVSVVADHYSLLRRPAVTEVASFLHAAFEAGLTGQASQGGLNE